MPTYLRLFPRARQRRKHYRRLCFHHRRESMGQVNDLRYGHCGRPYYTDRGHQIWRGLTQDYDHLVILEYRMYHIVKNLLNLKSA